MKIPPPNMCGFGNPPPDMTGSCLGDAWMIPVDSLMTIPPGLLNRHHAFILPDNTVWTINHAGNGMVLLGVQGGSGAFMQIVNTDGSLAIDGSGTEWVTIDLSDILENRISAVENRVDAILNDVVLIVGSINRIDNTINNGIRPDVDELLARQIVAGDNVTVEADGRNTIINSTVDPDIFRVVDELPETGEENRIYLIIEDGGIAEQWVWINDTWKDKGSMDVDISDFITADDARAILETGNAGSATRLQTPRTLAVNSAITTSAQFDGSANATMGVAVATPAGTASNALPPVASTALQAWLVVARNCKAWLVARFNAAGHALRAVTADALTTARNFTIGSTTRSFDGAANVSWSLTDMGVFNAVYPVGSIYLSINSTNPGTLFGGTWAAFAPGRTLIGVGTNGTTSYLTANATGGAETSSTPSGGAGTSGSTTITTAQIPSHTHAGSSHTHGFNHVHRMTGHTHSTPNHTHNMADAIIIFRSGSNPTVGANFDPASSNRGFANAVSSGNWMSGWGKNQVAGNAAILSGGGGTTGDSGILETTGSRLPTDGATAMINTAAAGTGATGSTGGGEGHVHTIPNHTHPAQSVVQPFITCFMWRRTA